MSRRHQRRAPDEKPGKPGPVLPVTAKVQLPEARDVS